MLQAAGTASSKALRQGRERTEGDEVVRGKVDHAGPARPQGGLWFF